MNQRFGSKTYAQSGEDLLFLNIFDLMGVSKPTYMDVGCHHPTDISNTALLYERGSRGINIDPNQTLMELFKQERPEDINLCLAIGTSNTKAIYYMIDETSGRNSISEPEVKRFVRLHPEFKISKEVEVPVVTLNEVVEAYCKGSFPDLLTIDTEGLDKLIIQTADFTKSRPKIVCVETRFIDTTSMSLAMENHGFFRYVRICDNLIFIDQEYYGVVFYGRI